MLALAALACYGIWGGVQYGWLGRCLGRPLAVSEGGIRNFPQGSAVGSDSYRPLQTAIHNRATTNPSSFCKIASVARHKTRDKQPLMRTPGGRVGNLEERGKQVLPKARCWWSGSGFSEESTTASERLSHSHLNLQRQPLGLKGAG